MLVACWQDSPDETARLNERSYPPKKGGESIEGHIPTSTFGFFMYKQVYTPTNIHMHVYARTHIHGVIFLNVGHFRNLVYIKNYYTFI